MANLLDKFQKSGIGSKGTISDYTPSISPRGDFTRINNLAVILTNWNNILLTPKRTLDHDPDFGSSLYKYVFEPYDQDTAEDIKQQIKEDLMSQDDRAIITSIKVTFMPKGKKGFIVDIFAEYNGQVGQVSAKIDETSYFNFGA